MVTTLRSGVYHLLHMCNVYIEVRLKFSASECLFLYVLVQLHIIRGREAAIIYDVPFSELGPNSYILEDSVLAEHYAMLFDVLLPPSSPVDSFFLNCLTLKMTAQRYSVKPGTTRPTIESDR
jgi:hypothetical protein